MAKHIVFKTISPRSTHSSVFFFFVMHPAFLVSEQVKVIYISKRLITTLVKFMLLLVVGNN